MRWFIVRGSSGGRKREEWIIKVRLYFQGSRYILKSRSKTTFTQSMKVSRRRDAAVIHVLMMPRTRWIIYDEDKITLEKSIKFIFGSAKVYPLTFYSFNIVLGSFRLQRSQLQIKLTNCTLEMRDVRSLIQRVGVFDEAEDGHWRISSTRHVTVEDFFPDTRITHRFVSLSVTPWIRWKLCYRCTFKVEILEIIT